MIPRTCRWIGVSLALAGASTARGQQLDLRGGDGPVRFAYPTASNVCGTGDGILIREPDGSSMLVSGHLSTRDWQDWRVGDPPCRIGDATVRMVRVQGRWTDVRLAVGGAGEPEPGDRDLGYFAGQDAADALLDAVRSSGGRAARSLLLAAAVAGDAIIWPELLELARDRSLETRLRESALHWLGRQAAREAVAALGGIVRDRTEDDKIREAAVFALSQLPEEQAIPILIDVVRSTDDPRVVNRALFWLAEFDDPRATAVFEEILVGG